MKIENKNDRPNLLKVNNIPADPDDWASYNRDFFKKDPPNLNMMLNKIIKEKGNFFCSQPFIHMYMPTYGFQHICCNTSMSIKKHISETTFEERYNEPEFKKLRKEIVQGHKERERTFKTCLRCIQTEYHGFRSLRETYNYSANSNSETKKELKRLVKIVKDNPDDWYDLPEKFHTVELKVWGNYCNLKCIMCSPEDSSEVGKEQIELGERTVEDIKLTTSARTGKSVPFTPPLINYTDNYLNEKEYWEIIKRAIRIKLIGGETFLQKQNVQLLEKLVENGTAKDKELIIFTNNYGHPNMEYIRDLLENFKHISYKCSMEMWGEKNNYIRYPSDWKEVHKNIKLITSLKNTKLNVTCTLNPLTLGYVHEIVEGAESMKGVKPNFSSVNRPYWFTAHCIPDDIKDFYLDRYYSLSYDMIEKCTKAIETLEQREFDEERYNEMIKRIIARDKHRNDNILKYFPEWKKHFINDSYYQ
tara:strand:+ start:558 stop:1979 length:1422 start_codon:yes stop_codon:yes gene_type:complete